MCSPIQEYLFDACIGEKLEGIFDERSVCKRDKTLHGQGQYHGIEYTWRLTVQMTLCYNQATYPRRIKCEWFKSRFEGVGKDLSLLSTRCHNLSRPGALDRCITHHSLQGLFYFLRHIIALLLRTTSSSASSSSALLFWAHSLLAIIPALVPFVTSLLCSWCFEDRAKRNRKKNTSRKATGQLDYYGTIFPSIFP